MRRVLCLPAIAAVSLAACGNSVDHSRVPNVVGKPARDAEQALAATHLRWRLGTRGALESTAPTGDQISSSDQHPVTKQSPAAGTKARRGLVVELDTQCTVLRSHPEPNGQICID